MTQDSGLPGPTRAGAGRTQGRARGTWFLVLFILCLAACVLRPVVWAAQIYPKSKVAKQQDRLTAEKLLTRLEKLEDEAQQLVQATSDIKTELEIVKTRAAIAKRITLSNGTPCP